MKKCPVCDSLEGVRKIIYGMPSEEPDSSKYVLGGCDYSEDAPDFRCTKCATDFYKKGNRFHNRFISNGSGKNFLCKSCQGWIPLIDDIDWHECLPDASSQYEN